MDLEKNSSIYVAGHGGLLGSAILRALRAHGYSNILTRTHSELDLTRQAEVEDFFNNEKPEFVFLAAAKVGGIHANSIWPADFIYVNLAIQTNAIHAAFKAGVRKLLFLGSSCIYPRLAPQPIREEHLLTGALEPTNEPYAVAKIAGAKMCLAYNVQYGTRFIPVMPTNLYGPGDNFDPEASHVIPGLINKFHDAAATERRGETARVTLWGTGQPRRDFLHVDDCARACLCIMEKYDESRIINVGTGRDISIMELAELVRDVSGFKGEVVWDDTRPDGTPRKLLDTSRINKMGWKPEISLPDGIAQVYEWYLEQALNT